MNKVFFTLVFFFVVLNIKAQKAEYYPQVAFDSIEAKNMLANGKASVEGIAFTKTRSSFGHRAPLGAKIYAKNVEVNLFPVTKYFEEWYQLRKKKENSKTSVYMSNTATSYRLVTKTDDYGRFKFENLKPGKYFIQSFASYTMSGTRAVYTGTGYNNYGGQTNYYQNQSYSNSYSDRIEEFVEITRDGQSLEIKLK